MKFYEQYPMMRPYIGKNFHNSGKPRLLLIGESHYLDEECPQRSDPALWYSGGSATLSAYEVEFISTEQILIDSRESSFANKSHSIWRNPLSVINEAGPSYEDFTQVADDVAFYNFFLRPGLDGDSIEYELCERDVEIANEAILTIFDELKPTAVVFLSMLARNCCTASLSVPMIATPHPGSAHWNRFAAKYGNRRGRDILGDFIKTTNWVKAPRAF